MKVKSFVTVALFSMMLIFPTAAISSGEPSPITLQYDREDPDYVYSESGPLAVRFTPPRIWLGQGHVCTLFKITAIYLFVASASWVSNAGFDVLVTDENHQLLKSFTDQHPPAPPGPVTAQYFSVDLAGWTDNTRYVETHFFVEFVALTPNPNSQETLVYLIFDKADIDEGEVSYRRSYRYTSQAWLPIELTDPYEPGDLMIRVELQPQTPNSFLPSLVQEITAADDDFFKGQAAKNTLIKKINEAMLMFERGSYEAGLNKLVNDIATKLADPRPTPATSWLKSYPAGSAKQKLVTSFAVECQGIVQMAQKSASPPGVHERCDFNNDGYDDLAIGVPHENVGGKSDAGAVNVLYGSPDGITEEQDQYWRQGINGVKGDYETGDHFGEALAIGDFNGDDYDDLAIGVPYEDAVTNEQEVIPQVGAVNVLYGSPSGLTEEGDQLWWQNLIAQEPGVAEAHDNFGATLAAGDFNGDGYDDLAVGVPQETKEAPNSGEVDVLYGSSAGLTASQNQVWSQGPLEGAAEWDDYFGQALTVGDFDGDGFEDLAIGVPLEDIGDIADAGAVNIVYGSIAGLTVTDNQIWNQDEPITVYGVCETADYFGGSLTAGDFNGDGRDDLAIGVPGEGGNIDNGFVNIIYGSSSGLSAAGNAGLYAIHYIREECTEFEYFGASLATGDFDQDGYEDLAVGVPAANIQWESQSYSDAGAVYVTYGCSLGLLDPFSDSARWDIWLETDLPFAFTLYDLNNAYFGRALTVGDFNQDAHCDLAIGVPMAASALFGDDQAGVVKVMYANPDGLSTTSFSNWWQDKAGVDGDSEPDDNFGNSLPGSRWLGIQP